MKVVILCGGFGTRLRESMGLMPKPLVEIGGKPILRHVMEGYARCGFKEFILCLGFGGDAIRRYFQNSGNPPASDWVVHCQETGLDTPTGGRLKRIEPLIEEETFLATYADGVSNVPIPLLLEFHKKHGRIGTLTAVNPVSPFGEVAMESDGRVTRFVEKPRLQRWINGGFFVFNRAFFRYLRGHSVLEKEPLESLARDRQLYAYPHAGFWCCMDTYKDTVTLNELCAAGTPPWAVPAA